MLLCVGLIRWVFDVFDLFSCACCWCCLVLFHCVVFSVGCVGVWCWCAFNVVCADLVCVMRFVSLVLCCCVCVGAIVFMLGVIWLVC